MSYGSPASRSVPPGFAASSGSAMAWRPGCNDCYGWRSTLRKTPSSSARSRSGSWSATVRIFAAATSRFPVPASSSIRTPSTRPPLRPSGKLSASTSSRRSGRPYPLNPRRRTTPLKPLDDQHSEAGCRVNIQLAHSSRSALGSGFQPYRKEATACQFRQIIQ